MTEYEIVVDKESNGKRIDAFLSNNFEQVSRSYIVKLIEEGNVTVNGTEQKTKKGKVKENDLIKIVIPEPEVLKVEAQDIPIEIVYEDDDVIVVNKPRGMVVHPAPGNYDGTLVNALMHHAESLSSINGVIRPGIVHRIDKDTSGLLMIAKNNNSHNALAEQLHDHTTTRVYYAIVHGKIREESGTVNAPIARSSKDRLKMAVVPGGREAVTHFEVIERFPDYTLLKLKLETGRTHQIRVHMTYIQHPLLGDQVYGPKKAKIKHNGQLLHAKTLGFVHPTTGEYVEFDSELPEYFVKTLNKVRSVSSK